MICQALMLKNLPVGHVTTLIARNGTRLLPLRDF